MREAFEEEDTRNGLCGKREREREIAGKDVETLESRQRINGSGPPAERPHNYPENFI